MDFVKKAQSALGGQSHNTNTNTGAAAPGGATGTQPGAKTGAGQDYGDKAFSAISSKAGYHGNAETNERITDGARGAFEKFTGKKVPEKFSN